jgi:hypothetical protein
MTGLMQPDIVRDQGEVVMRRSHQSLIDDKSDAVQSSRAIGDVVTAVQKKGG